MKPDFWAKNRGVIILLLIFAFSLLISVFNGNDVARSCLFAILISVLAGGAAMALMAFTATGNANLQPSIILVVGLLRLLIMLVGSVTILVFIPIHLYWFLTWIGLFYACFLTWEIFWVIKLFKDKNEGISS